MNKIYWTKQLFCIGFSIGQVCFAFLSVIFLFPFPCLFLSFPFHFSSFPFFSFSFSFPFWLSILRINSPKTRQTLFTTPLLITFLLLVDYPFCKRNKRQISAKEVAAGEGYVHSISALTTQTRRRWRQSGWVPALRKDWLIDFGPVQWCVIKIEESNMCVSQILGENLGRMVSRVCFLNHLLSCKTDLLFHCKCWSGGSGGSFNFTSVDVKNPLINTIQSGDSDGWL